MTSLSISTTTRKEREHNALQRNLNEGHEYTPFGQFQIPCTDFSDLDEENHMYIFPSCGHVHGYHKSLEGKPCPLCRKQGHFVPFSMELDTTFSQDIPSYVMNPCGHVMSKTACEKWANIPLFVFEEVATNTKMALKPCCPICKIPLRCPGDRGGPFNKVVVQTETGRSIQDIEDHLA